MKKNNFSPRSKYLLLRRAHRKDLTVSQYCRCKTIPRSSFYYWKRKLDLDSDRNILSRLADGRKGKRRNHICSPKYARQANIDQINAVLNCVTQYPHFSVGKIHKYLLRNGNLTQIGYHGIQNLLKRHNLNHLADRRIYAQSNIQPKISVQTSRVIPNVSMPNLDQLSPLVLPGPPPEVKLQTQKENLSRFTVISRNFSKIFFTGLITFSISFFLLNIISNLFAAHTSAEFTGQLLASIALVIGMLFFIYSIKYYLTIAFVLIFSRRISLDEKKDSRLADNLSKQSQLSPDDTLQNFYKHHRSGLIPDLKQVTLSRHPFVSIHLPLFNEKRVVNRLLEAVTSMDYPMLDQQGQPIPNTNNYEVIICDDSTDKTKDIVNEWKNHPLIRISHRNNREGFKGGALKKALSLMHPRAEFVLVFDADFLPYPDTITQFLKYFQVTAGSLEFNNERLAFSKLASRQKTDGDQNSKRYTLNANSSSNIAAIQGYQWHVLNKSENWITKGVRTEYAGSYVVERSGTEIYQGLKQIAGSVYMIRSDVLKGYSWGHSITEDFELTLKLYRDGWKVVYTPYIQAPSECVSTLKRLIRQRMRWAEGHSHNIRKHFGELMFGKWKPIQNLEFRIQNEIQSSELSSSNDAILNSKFNSKFITQNSKVHQKKAVWIPSRLSFPEKIEFLYLSPYYLQSAFFLVGTFFWFVSEAVLRVRLPFWTAVWGWSLVLTNMLSLPLLNTVGLFLEEAEEKDYAGIASFILLSYILAPFQAYASIKGFLESQEGPWFRTPKTGRITDTFKKGNFYRWIFGIFGQTESVITRSSNSLIQFGQLNQFAYSKLKHRLRFLPRTLVVTLLIISTQISYLTLGVKLSQAPGIGKSFAFGEATASGELIDTTSSSSNSAMIDDHNKNSSISSNLSQTATDAATVVSPSPQNSSATPSSSLTPVRPNENLVPVSTVSEATGSSIIVTKKEMTTVEDLKMDVKDLIKTGVTGSFTDQKLAYYYNYQGGNHNVYLKSEAGIQRYAFSTQSLDLVLSEAQLNQASSSAGQFIPQAISTPIFQYQDKIGIWRDYIEQIPNHVITSKFAEIEKNDSYIILTQSFSLYAPDTQSLAVNGSIEFKLGIEHDKYVSKLTFKLNDNGNTNRLIWDTGTDKFKLSLNTKNQTNISTASALLANSIPESTSSAQILSKSSDATFQTRIERYSADQLNISNSNPQLDAVDPDLILDWSDFKAKKADLKPIYPISTKYPMCLIDVAPFSPDAWQHLAKNNADTIIFYPEGKTGELIIDPTVSMQTNTYSAIAVGTVTISTTTSAGSRTFSHTVAAGSNRMLVVTVASEDATGADRVVNSITWNTTENLTSAKDQQNDTDNVGANVWYLVNPTVATANVVVTFAGTVDSIGATAINLTNVHQTWPLDITGGANTTDSTTSTVSVTTTTNNDLVISALANSADQAMTSTQTEDADFSITNARHVVSHATQSSHASQTMDYSAGGATDDYAQAVAAFRPANNNGYQIDVANRYRAVMETGDTADYLVWYDRAQNNTSPNPTHEFKGPCILETNTYCLRDDAGRTTTIIESDSVRVKIRVEGKFGYEGSTGYLTQDTSVTPEVSVIEDYTFTTEGAYIENKTDFGNTGVTLDAASGHNGYEWAGIYTDVTDAAYDDTGNLTYGDGNTEGTITADGAIANTNTYAFMPGTGAATYQDGFVGVERTGWYDDTTGGTHQWYWDENESGTQDLLTAQEQNHNTSRVRTAKWYFLMLPEASVDAEVERESYNNDARNPDFLTYTTGSRWDDMPVASTALMFDGVNDVVNAGSGATLDDMAAVTVEAWIYPKGVGENTRGRIVDKSNTAAALTNGWLFATYGTNQLFFGADFDGVSDVYKISSTYAVTLNKWQHVVATWDGSSSFANIHIYIDGTEVSYATQVNGAGSRVTDAGQNLWIGNDSTGSSTFNGAIEELRVYNAVIASSTWLPNMYKQISPTADNLVAYLQMNENTGTTTFDETTNSNDGAITEATWTTGVIPDHYNESEAAYPVTAEGDQISVDIDGDTNVSNTLVSAVTAADNHVHLTSSAGFPDEGGLVNHVAFIDGDKFSYNDVVGNDLNGVPITGDLALVGHASGAIVSSMNRYKPQFKVRNYHYASLPSVTLEGSTLASGTDYNVAYKPVTASFWAQDITWATTFENDTAITTPDVGTAGTVCTDGTAYAPGKSGAGRLHNLGFECNDYFPTSGNIDLTTAKGGIEFWAKPSWASATTGTSYVFTGRNDIAAISAFNFYFCGSDVCAGADIGSLRFEVRRSSAVQSSVQIANANLNWSANDWVHYKITWDDTLGADQMHIYVNGTEPAHTHTNDGSLDLSLITLTNIHIGGNFSGSYFFQGMIDEYRVYSSATAPTTLAMGGDTANASEYLNRTDTNQTFSFAAKDASKRGEYLFFGTDSKFNGLNIDLATNGATNSGSLNLDWEYYKSGNWASIETITGFIDTTNHLTQDGDVHWSAEATGWIPCSVNGSPNLYFIRASLNNSSGAYNPSPIENQIRTDIILMQYLSTISTNDQTFVIVPENLWPLILGLPVGLIIYRRRKQRSKVKILPDLHYSKSAKIMG